MSIFSFSHVVKLQQLNPLKYTKYFSPSFTHLDYTKMILLYPDLLLVKAALQLLH